MSNTLINITENGTTTLATSGKYCDRNIDVVVNVAGSGGGGEGGFELPTELTIDTEYWATSGAWDWYLEAVPSLNITMTGSDSCRDMFSGSKVTDLSHIHITAGVADCNKNFMFQGCTELTALPVIDWTYSASLFSADYIGSMFAACYNLRNIPADFFKMTDENGNKTDAFCFAGKQGNGTDVFNGCYSLRKLPDLPKTWYFNNQLNVYKDCYVLDELTNIPVTTYALTSNKFSNTFSNLYRAKDVTFAVQDDGTPFKVQWKSQTIDLTGVGWANPNYKSYIFDYNSGITADKLVNSSATYNALRDDPDWYATDWLYSRYNRLSADRTLKSLPDTSAYGTNTIKFKGIMGDSSGGAIKYLTEEDIAAAAAKGWTVTLV